MTKNLFYNDLIGVALFAVVLGLLHFIGDPSDGLTLPAKIAIIPVFAMSLSSMAELQLIAYRAPVKSFKTVMKGASSGIIMGCMMLVSMVDLSDRTAVLIAFLIQFTIMSVLWAMLGSGNVTDRQVQKQTRFSSVSEFEGYVANYQFKPTDWKIALASFALSIASFLFGSVALGIVFMLTILNYVTNQIDLAIIPKYYRPIRAVVAGLSAAGTMYFYSFSG